MVAKVVSGVIIWQVLEEMMGGIWFWWDISFEHKHMRVINYLSSFKAYLYLVGTDGS